MNCMETGRLLDAHVDGELEVRDTLAVQAHLESCPRCRRTLAALEAAREAVARHAQAPRAPAELRYRLRADIDPPARGRIAALLRSPFALAAPGVCALLLSGWVFLAGPLHAPDPAPRVVYHISNGETAGAALRNLRNHLQASPAVKVVVVAHNSGVDFLLSGARDETGAEFAPLVREFGRRGVEFRVCYNTLERRGIGPAQVVPGATVVPSGIAEIGRLQTTEGYAYMRL